MSHYTPPHHVARAERIGALRVSQSIKGKVTPRVLNAEALLRKARQADTISHPIEQVWNASVHRHMGQWIRR